MAYRFQQVLIHFDLFGMTLISTLSDNYQVLVIIIALFYRYP